MLPLLPPVQLSSELPLSSGPRDQLHRYSLIAGTNEVLISMRSPGEEQQSRSEMHPGSSCDCVRAAKATAAGMELRDDGDQMLQGCSEI